MKHHDLLKLIFGDSGNALLMASVTSCSPASGDPIIKFMREEKNGKPLRYNDFNGGRVANFLDGLIDNGDAVGFRFGREYSPVLYLTVSQWVLQSKRTPEQMKVAIARIMEGFKALKADEVSCDGNTIRAWWD